MPFQKYEVEAKPSIDVKINSNGISLTTSALEAHGLASADYVNLYWDGDLHIIGIAASSKEDKSSFKITVRGRGTTSKFISASKFFDKFGIDADNSTVASNLKEVGGIVAFDIELPSASKPYTGKRRGRKPRNAEESAE